MRSPLLGEALFSFFSCRYYDVSVPCVSLLPSRMTFLQNVGLSHSEIFGSKVICTYPKLIAAYHVLHHLREPRHPPCALAYFLSNVLFAYCYWLWNCFRLSILHTRTRTVWYILLALTFNFTFCTSCQRSFLFSERVENNGFEPLTLCVQGRCSSQLS